MINFFYIKEYKDFENLYNSSRFRNDSIVFIEDTSQIWTHDKFYSTRLSTSEIEDLVISSSNISNFIDNVVSQSLNNYYTKDDINAMFSWLILEEDESTISLSSDNTIILPDDIEPGDYIYLNMKIVMKNLLRTMIISEN